MLLNYEVEFEFVLLWSVFIQLIASSFFVSLFFTPPVISGQHPAAESHSVLHTADTEETSRRIPLDVSTGSEHVPSHAPESGHQFTIEVAQWISDFQPAQQSHVHSRGTLYIYIFNTVSIIVLPSSPFFGRTYICPLYKQIKKEEEKKKKEEIIG